MTARARTSLRKDGPADRCDRRSREAQPIRNIVLQRAMNLAIRNAALLAPRRLGSRVFGGIRIVDFIEVLASLFGRALVRHSATDADELLHWVWHTMSLPRLTGCRIDTGCAGALAAEVNDANCQIGQYLLLICLIGCNNNMFCRGNQLKNIVGRC